MLLDCQFRAEGAQNVKFASSVSCFDYDLVIWDMGGTARNFEPENRSYLTKDVAAELKTALGHRKAEFAELAKLGRSLAVFPSIDDWISYDTGRRVGGNALGATQKEAIQLSDCLPFRLTMESGRGAEMQPRGSDASSLWREAKGWLFYRGILKSYPGDPLFFIKGTDKVVGSTQRNPGGGSYFVLPEPWSDMVGGEGFRPPSEKVGGGFETLGKIITWLKSTITPELDDLPDWVGEYSFPDAADRRSKIAQMEEELARVLERIDSVKSEQAEDDLWKVLSYGQGGGLEAQVRRAFDLFGFDILEAVEGRADLRVSYGGKMAVIEVKGLAKSAAEKNAAQLEKWVSEEISAGGDHPKPILVVNTWRNDRPDERNEVDFPNQMLKYVTDRNHCLVSGLQLLAMVRAALQDESMKERIASELMSTVGVVDGWAINGALVRD